MGIEVKTVVELTCDGEGCGNGKPVTWSGAGTAYTEQRAKAGADGWRFPGNGKVYGPCHPAPKKEASQVHTANTP